MKYELTIEELEKMCREFSSQLFYGEVSNDKAWIELYLKDKK